jgi:hypothetical protein
MKALLHCAILSSSARFEGDDIPNSPSRASKDKIFGDASETALLKLIDPIERVSHIRSTLYSPAIDR